MPTPKVICIGSATKDIFLNFDETIVLDNPSKDPSLKKLMGFEFGAKLYAQSYREEVGGSAVNIGVGLKNLGLLPFVFSRVSKSSTGSWITKKIGKYKLKKNYLQQNGGEESEISVVVSDLKHKDHVIFRTGDSINKFDLKKSLDKFKEKVDLVYIGSQKNNWEDNLRAAIVFCNQRKIPLICNPSSYQISKEPQKFLKYLKDISVLILNKDEAIELVMSINKEQAKKDDFSVLCGKIDKLIITDGANGVYAYTGSEKIHIPGTTGRVIDTVGAGDAFASGFIAGMIKEKNFRKALKWGMANSRAVITKIGAIHGLLNEGRIKALADKMENELQILK